jgi:hypothetical protein
MTSFNPDLGYYSKRSPNELKFYMRVILRLLELIYKILEFCFNLFGPNSPLFVCRSKFNKNDF